MENATQEPMKRGFFSRRDFLKGGVAVSALAALTACRKALPATIPTPALPASTTPGPGQTGGAASPVFAALEFFDSRQAAIVNAAAGRIIPGTPQDPGAKEAAVVVFIDRAIEGYDSALKPQYMAGIEGMEAYAKGKYKNGFASLTDAQQDDILTNMQANSDEAKKYMAGAGAFFAVLLNHVRQGMFSDPAYGGNLNSAGWKLVGHPGIVFGRPTSEQTCDARVVAEFMGAQEYYASHPS